MPSCPHRYVASDGISRELVQVQTRTAPISAGSRCALSSAASAVCRASSSRLRELYRRSSTPVFSRISSALIGDQL